MRDCLHPRDLAVLVSAQLSSPEKSGKVLNVSGGKSNSISLAQLSQWCTAQFGAHEISSDPAVRKYDVAWLVLDSNRAAEEWNWRPVTKMEAIFEEIAEHADKNPQWLEFSSET